MEEIFQPAKIILQRDEIKLLEFSLNLWRRVVIVMLL